MSEFLQSKKDLLIRRMMTADLDRMEVLEPKVYGEHHWTRNNFAQELNNQVAHYLVAESVAEKKVLGYLGFWLVVDEIHITTLGVDPDCRRQGIAETLLISTIDFALKNSARAITLEVRLSNLAAQKLYAKYGFQKQGLRHGYYEDNKEAALLLWTEDLNSDSFQKIYADNKADFASR